MAENSVYHERRQYKRLPVSSGVIAVLISSAPEIIGSVSDISLAGAKVTFHNPADREIDFRNLKVDLISDDRLVEAIPCSSAWERTFASNNADAAGDLRQCGIQFATLNSNQIYLLCNFVERCAAPGVNLQPDPETPANSDQ